MYIAVHEMLARLGSITLMSPACFPCFQGMRQNCSFFRRGKGKAWQVWQAYPTVTSAFLYLYGANSIKQHINTHLPSIHGFVDHLYGLLEDTATHHPFLCIPPQHSSCERCISSKHLSARVESARETAYVLKTTCHARFYVAAKASVTTQSRFSINSGYQCYSGQNLKKLRISSLLVS